MLKWLQWSTIDLQKGQGGVEAHARCVARELKKHYQVETTFSQNPRDLFARDFDVIQTHGSSIPAFLELNARLKNRGPVWLQTLHGLSYERMRACREWSWLGGYRASAREISSIMQADAVVAVHDQLGLYSLIQKMKTCVAVCSNGWNSYEDTTGTAEAAGDEDLKYKLTGADPFWVFIGRGDDPVKNVTLLKDAWCSFSKVNLACVPGAGFEDVNWAIRLGSLNPQQIRSVLLRARGLVMTSHYEGLPLVVLEALALGTPVVATRVGGLKTLSSQLRGLRFVDLRGPNKGQMAFGEVASGKVETEKVSSAEEIRRGVQELMSLEFDEAARRSRAIHNRQYLQTWQQVAAQTFEIVASARQARAHELANLGQTKGGDRW